MPLQHDKGRRLLSGSGAYFRSLLRLARGRSGVGFGECLIFGGVRFLLLIVMQRFFWDFFLMY